MKVLNVIDLMNPVFGGAEERVFQMSRHLRLAEVDVDILTTNWRLDREWISTLTGGNNYFVNAIHYRYLIPFGAGKWLDQNISKYDVVNISKNWSLLAIIAASAAVKHGIPYVFSGMGFVSIHNRSRFLKLFFKYFLTIPLVRRASACIAVTNEEKMDLINLGVSAEKVHLIPNGVIASDFLHRDDQHFRRQYSLGDRKIILFIGRMDPIKGVHLIIDAFYRMRIKLKDWCLVLVGTQTSYREKMERKALNLGLQDRIIFLDPIFGKLKSEAYHTAEFIVVPSVKDAMTIIAPEAACCAKPVLITNTSDFGELARCGGSIEVDPTIDGLEKGLEILTNIDCDLVGMGKKGFDYVVNNFGWDRMSMKYIELFDSVAKTPVAPHESDNISSFDK